MPSPDEKKRRLISAAEQITANTAGDLLTAKDFEAQLAFACGRERDLNLDDIRHLTAKIERDGKRAGVITAAALQIIELQQATPPGDAVNRYGAPQDADALFQRRAGAVFRRRRPQDGRGIRVYREWLPHDPEAFDKVLELYIKALDVTLNEAMRTK